MTPLRILLLYGCSELNATFSYQWAWPRAFGSHPRFQCTHINLLDRRWPARLRAAAVAATWRGDAVVLLHSTFSNACLLSGRLFELIRRMPQPKAYFLGNEYKLMPEKMQFCEELPVRLLVSQCRAPRVHQLYRDRLGCTVMGMVNTGLDPTLFRPVTPLADRPIEIGYRADDTAAYIGHTERREMADYFARQAATLGLRVDISLDPLQRFTEQAWAGFLDRCRGQLGTEAGGDFFELTDDTRRKVNEFTDRFPEATFAEIWARFFKDYRDPVPLRILSGRNVEAAGTRTVQILFEGAYDGYFQPDVHYIPLKKDFSNVDEVMRKFRDAGHCHRVTDNAYELAMGELRYDRLVDAFADALSASL
jgi:hypothetical protein